MAPITALDFQPFSETTGAILLAFDAPLSSDEDEEWPDLVDEDPDFVTDPSVEDADSPHFDCEPVKPH